MRPEYRSYDLMEERTHDGRKLEAIIDVLSDLFIPCDVPDQIRSDNGPDFVSKPAWILRGRKAAHSVPAACGEDGYGESFNARYRTSGSR